MASCVRNIRTKNCQNLIIGFKLLSKMSGMFFLGHSVQCFNKNVPVLFCLITLQNIGLSWLFLACDIRKKLGVSNSITVRWAKLQFLFDVSCQKLTKSTNVSRSYSRTKSGTFFIETRCIVSDKKFEQVNMVARRLPCGTMSGLTTRHSPKRGWATNCTQNLHCKLWPNRFS